jgi:hypothetical protein
MGLSICRSIIDAHGAGCGRPQMSLEAQYFSSPYQLLEETLE